MISLILSFVLFANNFYQPGAKTPRADTRTGNGMSRGGGLSHEVATTHPPGGGREDAEGAEA